MRVSEVPSLVYYHANFSILDEPSRGLAPRLVMEMLKMIHRFNDNELEA
jgi:ABC-type branched-subunit amino acid transport system ATPase component